MIHFNKVKAMLREGRVPVGTFLKQTDPSSVEILALAGMDYFVLDSEHVAVCRADVTNLIRAAELHDIVPIIRVRENRPVEVLQALDAGALGVQIPNVDTYEEAQMAVSSARYAPKGNRGFAPSHRAAGFNLMDKFEYIRMANEEILTILHCETMEAVQNLDRILTLDELDVIFIGPMDLSQSMGPEIMGHGDHPALREVTDDVIRRTLAAGKIVGTVAASPAEAQALIEKGVQFVPVSSDQGFIASGARAVVQALRKGCAK